jgi:uncharacterized protein YjbI with pentapeptide repeats
MLSFANQNLQNRSFKGKNLSGVDFQNADIRGCNFQYAQLSDANFAGARAGQSRRQKVGLILLTLGVAIAVGDVVARLVFNTIAQSPLDPSASYIPVLSAVLSGVGVSSALSALWRDSKRGHIARIVTATLCGALVGFTIGYFYGLALRDTLSIYVLHHPDTLPPALFDTLSAIARRLAGQRNMLSKRGIVVGAIVLLLLSRFRHTTAFRVAVALAGTLMSYGAAFFWGTIAGAFLSTHEFGLGVVFSLVTVFYLWCTTTSLFLIVQEWKAAVGTSFRGADLTDATFENADVRHTDFSKAIGYFPQKLR